MFVGFLLRYRKVKRRNKNPAVPLAYCNECRLVPSPWIYRVIFLASQRIALFAELFCSLTRQELKLLTETFVEIFLFEHFVISSVENFTNRLNAS